MTDTITIESRYNGPPNSGNGGYVSGMLARLIEGPAEATLRIPPPLDKPLQVKRDGTALSLWDDDILVAEAKPATIEIDIPAAPSLDEANDAATRYSGFKLHAFPTCFVCGPDRDEGDGLRLFTGSVNGGSLVASPWLPHDNLYDEADNLKPEFYWAALDCPGAFSLDEGTMAVLGRMTASIEAPVVCGVPHIAIGWHLESDGRKHYTGTAILNQEGVICARAKQIWIELKS